MSAGCALIYIQVATLAVPKKSLAMLAFFREPCRSANKGTPCKINSTKNKWIESTKRAIAADPLCDWRAIFCLSLSIIKFILFGCIFIFRVTPLSSHPHLFGSFSSSIILFEEILSWSFLRDFGRVFTFYHSQLLSCFPNER